MILSRQTTEQARAFGRALAAQASSAVLVFALLLTGGGFLIAAAYGWLSRQIGSDAAAAVVGLVLVVLAGVVALVGKWRRDADQARAALIAELAAARAPPSDPLQNILFEASFELGRLLMAKRRR